VTARFLSGCVQAAAQFRDRTIIKRVTDDLIPDELIPDEWFISRGRGASRTSAVAAPNDHRGGPSGRRRMLAVPVWNIIDGATPRFSDSGLELCGFDYCVVQEGVREAGQGVTMGRLANTFLSEDDAQQLADSLVGYLGVEPVTVDVVDRLEAGSPANTTLRPARSSSSAPSEPGSSSMR
jgi:hypothetical protein